MKIKRIPKSISPIAISSDSEACRVTSTFVLLHVMRFSGKQHIGNVPNILFSKFWVLNIFGKKIVGTWLFFLSF